MSLGDRLNRLDTRTGADRVGQGLRLYGIYLVWPLAVVFGLVFGTASLLRGWLVQGFVMYGFAGGAALFMFFGIRASRSYRAYKRSVREPGSSDERSTFDMQ